jgi:hypothetical protein
MANWCSFDMQRASKFVAKVEEKVFNEKTYLELKIVGFDTFAFKLTESQLRSIGQAIQDHNHIAPPQRPAPPPQRQPGDDDDDPLFG